MDKQLLRELAQGKLDQSKQEREKWDKETEKWKKFIHDIDTEDVIVLSDNEETVPAVKVNNQAESTPVAEDTTVPFKNGKGVKYPWADTIRDFFEVTGKNKAQARDIDAWVIKRLKLPNTFKQKVRAQAMTFEREGKLIKTRERKKVYYTKNF